MKKLLGPLIGVVVTCGVLWVAKELKGLGSIEFGILDEDDPEEEEEAGQAPLTFWEDLLRQRLMEFKRYLDNAEEDCAAEQLEADVVIQTGMTFEEWLQSPEAKRCFDDAEEPLEVIQRLGDYADVVGEEVLTLADLEGIDVPDLTTIAEDLRQSAGKSIVDG